MGQGSLAIAGSNDSLYGQMRESERNGGRVYDYFEDQDDDDLLGSNRKSCTYCDDDKERNINPRYDHMQNSSSVNRQSSRSIGGIVADQLQPR